MLLIFLATNHHPPNPRLQPKPSKVKTKMIMLSNEFQHLLTTGSESQVSDLSWLSSISIFKIYWSDQLGVTRRDKTDETDETILLPRPAWPAWPLLQARTRPTQEPGTSEQARQAPDLAAPSPESQHSVQPPQKRIIVWLTAWLALTVLMRDVLSDVNTATLQQLGLPQYVLLVFPGSETDNTRSCSVHLRSRVYPLHLHDYCRYYKSYRTSVLPEEMKCLGKSSDVPSKSP